MHIQNLIKFHRFVHKISSGNQILTIIKGHNCVVNLRKWTPNNPNLDPINVIEYAKFGLILLLRSQYIERKRTRNDGNTESRTTLKIAYPRPRPNPPPHTYFVCGGYKNDSTRQNTCLYVNKCWWIMSVIEVFLDIYKMSRNSHNHRR